MSKGANAGELNTAVFFVKLVKETDKDGFQVPKEENVFGTDLPVYGKWVNVHGTEVFTAMQLELREPVTFTTRYSPKLCDVALTVYRKGDAAPYEVISIDNVENRNEWLEMKLQRKVTAR